MFSIRTIRLAKHSQYRFFRTSILYAQQGKDPQLSQGNVAKPSHSHPYDPQDQAARAARAAQAEGQTAPYDAATSRSQMKAERGDVSGNPESVGFAEQVGSQSPYTKRGEQGQHGSTGRQEDTTPPGLFSTIKKNLGLGTTTGQAKQNRDGGKGVTGTGTPRSEHRMLHTSTAAYMADPMKGLAPQESRQPKDSTYGDQNTHLTHKSHANEADKGKGNADTSPKLPSHQVRRSRHAIASYTRGF